VAVGRKKPQRLRDLGLQSERLLWPTKGPGAFEEELGPEQLERSLGLTTLDRAVAWAQTRSMWPDTFGLACCAIEMMSIVSARYDIARFGMEAFRASPRQADLLIVSGRVSHKMAGPLRQIYDQMLEPRWAISMGACSSSGGMFSNYAVVQGADKFMPIDIHIPGCPPRPEALFYGFNKLQRAIQGSPDQGWRRRYNAIGTEEWARDDVIAGQPSEASEAAYARARQAVATSAESTGPEGPGGPTQRGAGTH